MPDMQNHQQKAQYLSTQLEYYEQLLSGPVFHSHSGIQAKAGRFHHLSKPVILFPGKNGL